MSRRRDHRPRMDATPCPDREGCERLYHPTLEAGDVCECCGVVVSERAKVITLCGSTRFKADFESWNSRLTLEGNVVLSVGVFVRHPEGSRYNTPERKAMLDRLHLQKIDMADEVFVIDPGGYVGESTAREIAYAEAQGKPVRRLSVVDPTCVTCGRDNRNDTHSALALDGEGTQR